MSDFHLRIATPDEILVAVSLGETLLEGKLASSDVIDRVQQATGITAWVTGRPIDGIFLIIPLSTLGEQATRKGTFIPEEPDINHLAPKGGKCAGVYVGIYAGATKQARRNIMMASANVRIELFGSVPCFARAATADGARSMLSLGFKPAGFGASKLYVQEALDTTRRAA